MPISLKPVTIIKIIFFITTRFISINFKDISMKKLLLNPPREGGLKDACK